MSADMNTYGGGEHEKDKGYRMFIGQDKAFESAIIKISIKKLFARKGEKLSQLFIIH